MFFALFVQLILCASLHLSKRGVGVTNVWPDAVIPYQFSPHLPSELRNRVLLAMREWRKNVPFLRFVARKHHEDYVFIDISLNGCRSQKGKLGGRQLLLLSYRCQVPQILHELGHTIGLVHEHQRGDRDKHIQIHWDNIRQKTDEFTKLSGNKKLLTRYDFKSIMHYHGRSFSKSGKPTITTKNGWIIPFNSKISQLDVEAVYRLYQRRLR